jgi:hypothetical protein
MSPPRPTRKRNPTDPQRERLVSLVEEELRRRKLTTGILQQLASAIEPSVRDMDPRRFHSEYVVPAQLRIAGPGRKRKKRRTSAAIAATAARRTTRAKRPGTVRAGAGAKGAAPSRAFTPEAAPIPAPADSLGQVPPVSAAVSPEARRSTVAPPAAPPAGSSAAAAPARPEMRAVRSVAGATRALGRGVAGAVRRRPERAVVRGIFLDWARTLAGAESEADWVSAVLDVDGYVDRVLRLQGPG